MKIYTSLFLSLITFSIFQCSGDSREQLQKELDRAQAEQMEKLKPDHDLLRSLQKEKYEFSTFSKSKEEALESYLKFLTQSPNSPESNLYALNRQELKEILYPNTLGLGTSLDFTPLKDYEELVWSRRLMGEEKIRESIGKADWKIKKIEWRDEIREFKVLKGYKPEKVELLIGKETKVLTEIKQVIEHQGKFKVAIVAP